VVINSFTVRHIVVTFCRHALLFTISINLMSAILTLLSVFMSCHGFVCCFQNTLFAGFMRSAVVQRSISVDPLWVSSLGEIHSLMLSVRGVGVTIIILLLMSNNLLIDKQ
jgi:ABC-type cobalt transport system substrate-binding protein